MLGDPSSKYYSVHSTPRGAGDARPTALSIIHDEALENKLTDKVILVTGGATSIGYETVRALHATGAHVYMTVRDAEKGRKAIEEILRSDPSNKAPIDMLTMHLDDLDSVSKAAKEFLEKTGGRLNVLVCNAGVMATPFSQTKDGFDTQFAVNYLGHFLLFHLLKDALLASAAKHHSQGFDSRVIMVSSEGHRQSEMRFDDNYAFKDASAYHPLKAYGQSKTACIYMANSIDRHFAARNLHAWSLHPGAIRSGITTHVAKMAEPLWNIPTVKAREKTAAQGAATTVYAAVGKEWEGRGGRYLSNCMEIGGFRGVEGFEVMDEGYASWVYEQGKQDRLWSDSLKMVGLEE